MADMVTDIGSGSIDLTGTGSASVVWAYGIPGDPSTPHDCRWEGQLTVIGNDAADFDNGINGRWQIHGKRKGGTVTILSTDALGTVTGWTTGISIVSNQIQVTCTIPNAVVADIDYEFVCKYQSA